jgi:hypothetical protein
VKPAECPDLNQDWQIRQAEHALRLYFVNFLRANWSRSTANSIVVSMVSTHVVKELRNPARSPLDLLQTRKPPVP